MSDTIDEIYLKIAQGIAKSITTSWDRAVINAEVFDDAANFNGVYELDGKTLYFEVEDDAYDYFEEIKEIMSGNNKWNRAKFTLKPSGDFSIDFQWDQALDDEIKANQ
ncbi:immunity protein YezG family protein [Thalassolituus marinus]|uniref:DUF600 family protein n=1 Tax=Thalassolituus marinus TaxID=671053 RepID=A0ABS7ZWR4_9GAMM|nr:immunity protein YezG family protein [Thalassolituus marinus]MCA6064820.1 DUF600 family protein [Thalassolituus marinus]